ncbi:hypothetical protein PINS_up023232 [Pythium insidiosum]|nr:hypothetical protein PINS_up023232 [Pythium insidiosum]
MLTNPRLVNNAQALGQSEVRVTEDVTVGILASGQIFGELCVLQPGQSSQVTIRAQTMVEVLLLAQDDLARLRVQYHSGVMNALQESLLFHNPPAAEDRAASTRLGAVAERETGRAARAGAASACEGTRHAEW